MKCWCWYRFSPEINQIIQQHFTTVNKFLRDVYCSSALSSRAVRFRNFSAAGLASEIARQTPRESRQYFVSKYFFTNDARRVICIFTMAQRHGCVDLIKNVSGVSSLLLPRQSLVASSWQLSCQRASCLVLPWIIARPQCIVGHLVRALLLSSFVNAKSFKFPQS